MLGKIISVAVDSQVSSGKPGDSIQLTASVNGELLAPQDVIWSVSGNTSAGTAVSATGFLTIGADETAGTLTIRAVSAADNTKFSEFTVTVTKTANPAAPNQPSGTTGDSNPDGSIPATGDNGFIIPVFLLLFAAAALATTYGRMKRKEN